MNAKNFSRPATRGLSVYELGWVDLSIEHRLQVIGGMCLVDGVIDKELILDRIGQFTTWNPQYRSRLIAKHRASWQEDESFSLDRHIRKCSDRFDSSREILEYIASNSTQGFPDEHSPWIVNLFQPPESITDGRTAIAFMAHHSLTDGLGASRLFKAMLDSKDSLSQLDDGQVDGHSGLRSSNESKSRIKFAWELLKDFSKTRRRDPFTGQSSPVRTVLEFNWCRSRLNQARKRINASLQELILQMITRALQLYCQRFGQAFDLRAIVPMADGVMTKDQSLIGGHDIGYLDLPLSQKTTEQQLDVIRRGVARLRQRQIDQDFARLSRILERLPVFVRHRAAHRWSANANLLITLIPGGPLRPTIGGHEVTAIYGLPAVPPGQALAIGVVISRKWVHVSWIVDPQLVRDYDQLESDIDLTFDEMVSSGESRQF
jgi:hypothetical protein